MNTCRFDIYDIMACDVYWDYGTPGLPKEQHKWLVAFYATEGRFTPDLIESIDCAGPGGYTNTIANQEFTSKNRNGFIRDPATGNYWYMHNCPTGFMKDGEYTLTVRCKNGDVLKRSRYQDGERSRRLVREYQANAELLRASFSPSTTLPLSPDAPLEGTVVRWTPLSELSGTDAYYIYRVAEGRKTSDWDIQKLVWWDNIFVERLSAAEAGLNRSSVTIRTPLLPNSGYLYFVEITDSNEMGRTNICIFQPFGSFTTHAGKALGDAATA
jgi:hypothetical protein